MASALSSATNARATRLLHKNANLSAVATDRFTTASAGRSPSSFEDARASTSTSVSRGFLATCVERRRRDTACLCTRRVDSHVIMNDVEVVRHRIDAIDATPESSRSFLLRVTDRTLDSTFRWSRLQQLFHIIPGS